ncbi:hypothetical protein VU04_04625 [Desulfobulbus sp. TB]|nr:hypothetical protein [Desulfobulbus sp. TB]
MKGIKVSNDSLHRNKIFFITLLLATLLFPGLRQLRQPERFLELVPLVYGREVSAITTQSSIKKKKLVELAEQTKNSHDLERRIVNSATCGRIWNNQLAKVQGKIRNVAYRIQPLTGRSGLHIDVETGPDQTESNQYVVIHVFPETLIAKCPSAFHFTVGDTVTVSGSEFFTGRGGMQQNICAATIIRKKDVLSVRDPVTGRLERQLCCQEICKKNCSGLPPMCDRMCMGNCQNMWLKAVFQGTPFCPSCDKEYAKTIFDF